MLKACLYVTHVRACVVRVGMRGMRMCAYMWCMCVQVGVLTGGWVGGWRVGSV